MEQLFGAIPSLLNVLGPNADVDEAVIFAAWRRCAGEALSTRTAPLEFFENRLIIAVENETWRRHLEELAPQILFRINGEVGQGKVTFIEFRVDARAVMAARDKIRDLPSQQADNTVEPALAKAAEAIADEDLRQQFLSTAATYLAGSQQQ